MTISCRPECVKLKVLVLICLFALFGVGGVESQTTPQKVKIAVSSRGIAFIDLYIAQDRGFFREEGLEAELIQSVRQTWLGCIGVRRSRRFGRCRVSGAGKSIGIAIKVLAVTGHRALFWLVSRPEFKSIPELKGTNLGITSRNGSQHLVANRLLAAGGLDPAKEAYRQSSSAERPALLQALLAGSIKSPRFRRQPSSSPATSLR